MNMDFNQKNMLRSKRRHAKSMKKRKAVEVCKNRLGPYYYDEYDRKMFANKNADNLKNCSCWMCGNPRKYFKEETLQEKRLKENFKCEVE